MFFQKSWEFILKKYWRVKKAKKGGQKNISLEKEGRSKREKGKGLRNCMEKK